MRESIEPFFQGVAYPLGMQNVFGVETLRLFFDMEIVQVSLVLRKFDAPLLYELTHCGGQVNGTTIGL